MLPKRFLLKSPAKKAKKERTTSRLEQLKQIYKEAKILDEHLLSELNEQSESSMRRKKIYLYFTQLGKCAYTGKPIDFENCLNRAIPAMLITTLTISTPPLKNQG